MECMRGETVIYVRSSKDFKIVWKEKMHERKLPLYWELYQLKQGKYYQNWLHETVKRFIRKGRNKKVFCLRQPYGHCLLVTTNFSK